MKRRIQVMIVEDSPTQLILLEDIVNSDPRLQVVATATSAETAIRLLPRARPDVVSMDIHLPNMNGYEATQYIMREAPVPIVVVSASVSSQETEISMNSLKAGALAVVQKPPGPGHPLHAKLALRLCEQLAIMSDIKVVRQRRGGKREARTPPLLEPTVENVPRIIGIVASTGGPPALASLLEPLPEAYPIPLLVVQHMGESFLTGFIDWLNDRCALHVRVAEAGTVPRAGHVYVAPGKHHLEMGVERLKVESGTRVSFQCPSGTVLFRSLAREFGPDATGILLTGMGDDGAEGLLDLRCSGGHTIAEDSSTSIVYGMPRAAVELGAAREILPLPDIGRRIAQLGEIARS